jgi:hypothetical protein
MRFTGVVLVIMGLASLISGGIKYNRQATLLDAGGFKATSTEHRRITIAPVVATVILLGGVLLLAVPSRRLA